jgi:hypothetical protein
MADNHIIIGLGGTGGKTIAGFKRLLFENKNGETDPTTFGVDCIFVDTDTEALNMNGPEWDIMGTSVGLGKANTFPIVSRDMSPYIENANDYPNLKYWIGNKKQWSDLLGDSAKAGQEANQRRKLGRSFFAIRSQDFVKTLNSVKSNLEKTSKKTKFHIVAGLAGGTGSGSIVDVTCIIRKLYPNALINLYCVLPERTPSFNYTSYYHANGYAALLELNALAVGDFAPYDVSNNLLTEDEKIEIKDRAFNVCYLVADENEANFPLVTKGKPLGSLFINLSEFIFQTTVVTNNNIEQVVLAAEKMSNPEEVDRSGFAFSNKFYAFGYKRFAIPQQEIKEYFAYLFGYQAVLQFLYNNFNRAEGYRDISRNQSYNSIVANNEFLTKFNITRDHLILSFDILGQYKNEIRDKGIDNTFIEVMSSITNKVKQGDNYDGRPVIKEQWLDAILIWGNRYFQNGFRAVGQDGGVLPFYETKTKDKNNLATKIVNNLEEKLFEDWYGGKYSIEDVLGVTKAVLQYLKDEKEKFDTDISKNNQTVKVLEQAIQKIKSDWRPGFLSNIFNDGEGKVRDTQNNVAQILILKTKNKGMEYAKELIDAMIPVFNNLISNINSVNAYFNQIKETFQTEFLSRCVLDEKQDGASVLIKYYDPKAINAFGEALKKNNEIVDERISSLRKQIYLIAKDAGNYFEKLKKVNIDEIQTQLVHHSMQLANEFFSDEKLLEKISDEKISNENILEKLRDEYSGQLDKLREKINKLIQQAALSSIFDSAQIDGTRKDERALLVVLPDLKDDEDFVKQIKKLFTEEASNVEVATGGNPNEILLINLKRGAQIREFENVKVFKEKYDALIATQGEEKAYFTMHTEDVHFFPTKVKEGSTLMDSLSEENKHKSIIYGLFKPSEKEIKKRAENMQNELMPYMLLAKATGVLLDAEHPETGKNVLCLMKKDELSEEPLPLGTNLIEALDTIGEEDAKLLMRETSNILKEKYKHISTHDSAIEAIKSELREIQLAFNNNPLNVTVKRFKEAGLKAIEILKN